MNLGIDVGNIDYVIYHKNCLDGFASAFVAYLYFKSKRKRIKYHDERPSATSFPSDVRGKNVIIFDVAYSADLYMKMRKVVKSVYVIDHHITNKRELDGLPNVYIDVNRSGAMLAWNLFYPNNKPPTLIKQIQDGDLGKWEMPLTKELTTAIYMHYPMVPELSVFRKWEKLLLLREIRRMKKLGLCYVKHKNSIVERVSKGAVVKKLGKYRVCVVNAGVNAGDVASYLANERRKECDFGMAFNYSLGNGTYIFSLRSVKKTVDVSKIAEKYGGGGHKLASAFVYDGDIKKLLK
jgi:oligoribonuclease NrnB/cAMP/cGMP phosphodiesterase (DHH superfamily)